MTPQRPTLRHGLYAITPGPRPDLIARVEAVLNGGARLLQYRDTTQDHARRLDEAHAIAALCRRYGVPLLIERDLALAKCVQADGVHLGPDNASIAEARDRLGAQAIVGMACVGSLDRARSAAREGADYVSFGVFHASPTLPNARPVSPALLSQAAALGVSRVAIGGITPDNASALIAAGADMVASISTVFDADDPCAMARRFTSLFA